MKTTKIEDSLAKIAYELERKNDMLEISTLLDAADKFYAAFKGTTDAGLYSKCKAAYKTLMNLVADKLRLEDANEQ